MRLATRIVIVLLALLLVAATASAREAKTISEFRLRAGPNAKYELLVTIPVDTIVYVVECAGAYCKVDWNGYSGYGRASALQRTEGGPVTGNDARITSDEGRFIPVYPPYPYRAGHYPKADWYYDLPPYAAIDPRFYRKRYFMMAQERNRYRYMPHIFSRYDGYEGDDGLK